MSAYRPFRSEARRADAADQVSPCRAPAKLDFDWDGEPDALWRSCSLPDTRVLFARGTQFDIAAVNRQQALGYYIVGTGDFTGDQQPDLLWQHNVNGTTRVWEMSGTSFVAELNVATAPAFFYGAAVADFNNDGKADIMHRHRLTGENRVWLMNGVTMSSSVNLPLVVPVGARLAGVGDLDNDGKVDIVWHNPATTQMTFWKMNGTTRVSTQTLWGPLLALEFYVGALDDFDGDGKTDILWHNPLLTEAVVWRMNGTTKLGEYTIEGPRLLPGLPVSIPPESSPTRAAEASAESDLGGRALAPGRAEPARYRLLLGAVETAVG